MYVKNLFKSEVIIRKHFYEIIDTLRNSFVASMS